MTGIMYVPEEFETGNCYQDQAARMAQLSGQQAGVFIQSKVDDSGNCLYYVSTVSKEEGPNLNGDILPPLKLDDFPATCGVALNLEHESSFPKVPQLMESYELPPQYTVNKYPLAALISNVVGWHHDRNLIEGSTDKDQTLKLAQELGELSDSVCKGKDIRDDIGDMLVVMLNITERNNISLEDCLTKAWDDIKDRKGKMIDGIFVKESDL